MSKISLKNILKKTFKKKTKIITNATRAQGRPKSGYLDVEGMQIEVLPYASTVKYLGKHITFASSTCDEITRRIQTAWSKFMGLKHELTYKNYALNTLWKRQ